MKEKKLAVENGEKWKIHRYKKDEKNAKPI